MGGNLFGYGGYGGNFGGTNSWSSGAPPTQDERGAGTGWMLHHGSVVWATDGLAMVLSFNLSMAYGNTLHKC
jgi:hypothetical protein